MSKCSLQAHRLTLAGIVDNDTWGTLVNDGGAGVPTKTGREVGFDVFLVLKVVFSGETNGTFSVSYRFIPVSGSNVAGTLYLGGDDPGEVEVIMMSGASISAQLVASGSELDVQVKCPVQASNTVTIHATAFVTVYPVSP